MEILMTELNNNLITIDLSDSLKPISEKIVNTLAPISDTFSALFLFALQKPMEYKITKEADIESFTKKTREKYGLLNINNVNFDNIELIGKILEDSIYQLDKEQFRNFYSSLIISTIDNTKKVKPYYSSLLKEFSPDEAKLMNYFFNTEELSEISVWSSLPVSDIEKPKYPQNYLKYYYFDNTKNKYKELNQSSSDDASDCMLESISILQSFNLVEETFFDPKIADYLIENDEQFHDFGQTNKPNELPHDNYISVKTYKLTNLGKKIKSILTAYEVN